MADLTLYNANLPDNIEDLSKFVLIGREKLASVRAEIRAIDKLNLAKEVRDQKLEESRMLGEALLDAEVKVGEFLKQIPKAPGVRTDLKPIDTAVEKLNNQTWPLCGESCDYWDNGICKLRGNLKVCTGTLCSEHTAAKSNQKPKYEIIKDLGFSQKQAERFETLADNKDLVEQVKAEARENEDIPTRSRVLELAKARKDKQKEAIQDQKEYNKYIDDCKKVSDEYESFLFDCDELDVTDEKLNMWKKFLLNQEDIEEYLKIATEAIPKLLKIQKFLKGMI